MGHYDCHHCGEHYGHAPGCPNGEHLEAMTAWESRRADHIRWATESHREALRRAEQVAAEKFERDNPRPKYNNR